ncbi:MAG TPA: hypothetical protein VMU92_07625 [Acidobacteriaceae bacterium]|nr:hypothetical protein [Acidobacteriaceae bacterium]
MFIEKSGITSEPGWRSGALEQIVPQPGPALKSVTKRHPLPGAAGKNPGFPQLHQFCCYRYHQTAEKKGASTHYLLTCALDSFMVLAYADAAFEQAVY